jgi:hypothetical protein
MALVKYSCEVCGRVWDTEKDANACQETHQLVTAIKECRFKKKADPEKYPNSLVCTMADGSELIYYIGRAENQTAKALDYKSQRREQNQPSVRS